MSRTQSLRFAIRNRAPGLHRSSHRPRPRHHLYASVSSSPYETALQPSNNISKSCHRAFTRLSSLQALSRTVSSSRPQLPFLHPYTTPPLRTRSFLTWYLTPTRKARWRQSFRSQLRYHGYIWPTLLFATLLATGLKQSDLERQYPTPREWGFWTRWNLRSGLFDKDRCEINGGGLRGWNVVGNWLKAVLKQCEEDLQRQSRSNDNKTDGSKRESKAVQSEGIYVEGLGELGAEDLSRMSEPWKRGFYQTLMGCAKVAENLDGMARRKEDESSDPIPYESVIGPGNPRPKPLPWDKKGTHKNPPREDEVEDAFPPPENFYMRIMTNREFTDRQRLDAALAYADYLDFKGLWETAGDMYDWALDIAAGGLPSGIGADNVVDIQTGILNQGMEEHATENLFTACTAMGVHCARKGDVKNALPIFLSVLRARKNLQPAPMELERQREKQRNAEATRRQQNGFAYALATLKDLFIEVPYPAAASSGNERPYHSLKEACEEVGLMTYIGEILFATSDKEREKGLSWTRDSVGAAEAVLWVMEERGQAEGKERCQECLETGLANWKNMTRQMVKTAQNKVAAVEKGSGWLGSGIGKGSAVQKAMEEVARWQEEDSQIDLRKLKTASLVHPLERKGRAFYEA